MGETVRMVQLAFAVLCCGITQLVKTAGTQVGRSSQLVEKSPTILGHIKERRARHNPTWYEDAEKGAQIAISEGNILSFRFSREVNLRIAAETWLPHVNVFHDVTSGGMDFSGPMRKCLELLAKTLNFNYTYVKGDGYFGAPSENGSWNGMIGMLQRREIDIALGPFAMTHERRQVVDFTIPLFMDKMRILVMKPQPKPDPWGLVSPFSKYVWICIAASFIALVCTSFYTIRCLSTGGPTRAQDHVWGFFAILVGQALSFKPVGMALRFICSLWMMTSIIIDNSYSGSLTSLLAETTVTANHDSLQAVVKDNDINLIMEDNTAFTSHLKTAKEGIYKALSTVTAQRGIFEPAENLWIRSRRLVPDGRHALLAEELTLLKFLADETKLTGRCDFYISQGDFWPLIGAMAVVKGSPLLQLINARVLMLREYGIYDAWLRKELESVTHCMTPVARLPLLPYTLTDLRLAFLFLFGGLLIGFLVLLAELWCHRGNHRHRIVYKKTLQGPQAAKLRGRILQNTQTSKREERTFHVPQALKGQGRSSQDHQALISQGRTFQNPKVLKDEERTLPDPQIWKSQGKRGQRRKLKPISRAILLTVTGEQ